MDATYSIKEDVQLTADKRCKSYNLALFTSLTMNKLAPIFLLFTLTCGGLSLLCGCSSLQNEQIEFVKDQYGVVTKINPADKNVYLVFTAHFSTNDSGAFENFDGIEPVLNTLAEKEVKGSFFPTGNCFREEKYKSSIERIIKDGHYLSAHSNHHLLLCSYENRDSSLVTADSIKVDIAGMEKELERFGLKKEQYKWMIPPYEYYNQLSADVLRSLGYELANPTEGLETSLDWMGTDSPEYCSAQRLVQNIWDFDDEYGLNGAIILIHAMNYPCRTEEDRTYNHLGDIIDTLRIRGYGFKTFNDVIATE